MNLCKKCFICIAFIVSTVGAYFCGDKIPFSEQWNLYESLRTTSSIVFAVIGAWFAIIYPERLRNPFNKSTNQIKATDYNFKLLFAPIVYSTFIICSILLIGIVVPILKSIPFLLEFKDYGKTLSFGALCLLTFLQIWCVFITLYPADLVKRQYENDKARRKSIEHLSGH